MRNKLTLICIELLNNLGTLDQFKAMMTDKITSGQDSLFHMGKLAVPAMLENAKVKTLIRTYWDGPFELRFFEQMKNSLVKFFKKVSFTADNEEHEDTEDVQYASALSYGVWKHSI